MHSGLIRNACSLFFLDNEQDNLKHVNDNMQSKLMEFARNKVANMDKYTLEKFILLKYGDDNKQHDGPLVILQTSDEDIKNGILNELETFPVSADSLISRDGYPVKVTSVPGYMITHFYGDMNQPLRHTLRITKKILQKEEIDTAVQFYLLGYKKFTALADPNRGEKAVIEFNACVYYNPFASGARYYLGSALMDNATASSKPDKGLINKAEVEFKISRALGHNNESIENAIEYCQNFRDN